MTDRDTTAPALVSVCVCTFRRPDMLARLLVRLAEVAHDARDVAEVAVVVIDDDVSRSAEPVATAATGRFARGLQYHVSASGNISVARNAALDLGCRSSEWLALTDDDCMPETGWLRELITVQRRYGAELVTGTCMDTLVAGAPDWLGDEPFLESASGTPDGAEIQMGYIKNTLLAADAIRRHRLRFDPAFGGTGGEDAIFFYTAHEYPIDHRHAARAVVVEEVPLERSTLAYQLRRRFWYGNTEALTSLARRRTSRLRMAASGAKLALSGLVRPVGSLWQPRGPQLRFSTSVVLQGLGRTLGALGIRIGHR
jgi:succinoglycan biosynthesis protein ExoM